MKGHLPSPGPLATRISRPLTFWCCVLAHLACGGWVDGLRAAETPAPVGPLFQEATNQFQTMTSTLYQHTTRVDRAAGSYRYDCVGFVSYALKQAAPQARASAFKALAIQPGRIPSPPRYREFFASLAKEPQPGWQAVTQASELRPGDVVAWELKTKTSSGHAVVIGGVPVAGPDGTWVVEVYDSTASPHGDDSRPTDPRAEVLEPNGKRSGLGRGRMAFAADPTTGALIGYRWSPKSKLTKVPIAAGRPTS
jgi:hypothetical protein